jgi:hypothetical protein
LILKTPYKFFGIILMLFVTSVLCNSQAALGQEVGGKKLEVPQKSSPEKMDNKKVRTSKKRKRKGNPNKGSNKVVAINPFTWDWDRVMWFKAKKSDYQTKEYNPDKRTKRQTYDNRPNYESADRKAITNPSKMKDPLIPYDSRIAGEGPVLQKKRRPKNVNLQSGGPQVKTTLMNVNDPSETLSKAPKKNKNSEVDGKRLYSKARDNDRKPFDNTKLETVTSSEIDSKMDDDKIMFKRRKNEYAKLDNDKLLTAEPANRERKAYDDNKLMIATQKDKERKAYDDSKLMTALHGDRERKPFDDDKLMTAAPANRKRKEFDESKLMTATVIKPDKNGLDNDRLLTVSERKNPTDEMKETSKDISKMEGDQKRHFYVTSESHPGTKLLAAENTKTPFLAKTFQSVSSFFTSIWKDDTQPKYVTRKKPKERRDKKEGMIWDNSVHPDEWKKQEAESGEN